MEEEKIKQKMPRQERLELARKMNLTRAPDSPIVRILEELEIRDSSTSRVLTTSEAITVLDAFEFPNNGKGVLNAAETILKLAPYLQDLLPKSLAPNLVRIQDVCEALWLNPETVLKIAPKAALAAGRKPYGLVGNLPMFAIICMDSEGEPELQALQIFYLHVYDELLARGLDIADRISQCVRGVAESTDLLGAFPSEPADAKAYLASLKSDPDLDLTSDHVLRLISLLEYVVGLRDLHKWGGSGRGGYREVRGIYDLELGDANRLAVTTVNRGSDVIYLNRRKRHFQQVLGQDPIDDRTPAAMEVDVSDDSEDEIARGALTADTAKSVVGMREQRLPVYWCDGADETLPLVQDPGVHLPSDDTAARWWSSFRVLLRQGPQGPKNPAR